MDSFSSHSPLPTYTPLPVRNCSFCLFEKNRSVMTSSSKYLWYLVIELELELELEFRSFRNFRNFRTRHRGSSGLFTSSNLAQVEYNTKHAHYIHVKHTNIIRIKLFPSGIALVKKKKANKVRRCWYHSPFRSGVSIPDKNNYLKKMSKNNC